jgi:hypothetical protein
MTISGLSAFAPNANDQACATFTPTFTTSLMAPGYTALFQEVSAPGTTGTLCFWDQNIMYAPNQVTLGFQRSGTPVTPAFQMALGTGTNVTFSGIFSGFPPATVYNGMTLALGQFASAQTLTNGQPRISIVSSSGPTLGTAIFGTGPNWVMGSMGSATLSLVP